MDICINHLYNRQINKNLLQDVFYKLENFDNEKFLCFDVNSSGNLLVASTKTSLYFFNILSGTLLVQYNYYNEKDNEGNLKIDIPKDVNCVNNNECNKKTDGEEDILVKETSKYDHDKECDNNDGVSQKAEKKLENEEICNNDKIIINSENSNNEDPSVNEVNPMNKKRFTNEEILKSGDLKNGNICDNDENFVCVDKNAYEKSNDINDENIINNINKDDENVKKCSQLSVDNDCPINDYSLKINNKRKHASLKEQKIKKVKKRSKQTDKHGNRLGDNPNNTKGKHNDIGTNKKNTEDNLKDENYYIKKIQFIKNDEYLLCISNRYLYIYKICNYPITRIICIDLLYLCIGIETIISEKLFFPCFFSEYFYFLYKENENKGPPNDANNGSNDDINKRKDNFDKLKNSDEIKTNLEYNNDVSSNDTIGEMSHSKLFEKYYDIYKNLSIKTVRNFEIHDIKCINIKKKIYIDKNNEKRTIYIIDTILCLKEQIPYISRMYVEKKKININKNDINNRHINNFIIDINQTFPLVSLGQMNATFQENVGEGNLNTKKDIVCTKSKLKVKKLSSKGLIKNIDDSQENEIIENEEGKDNEREGTIVSEPQIDDNKNYICNFDGYVEKCNGEHGSMNKCEKVEKPENCDINMDNTKDEYMHFIMFYENYEKNRKYVKKLKNTCFSICLYKKKCKRRFKELPTTLNIYGNLDNILKEYIDNENNLKTEETKIFKKYNGYYLFDYSEMGKNDYFKYPCDLLKNNNIFKNIKRYENLDKNKYYIFVGTHSFILVFELRYIKNSNIKEANGRKKNNILSNDNVYEQIENISSEVYKEYNNFIKNVGLTIYERHLKLKYLFKIYLGIVTPLEIVMREKGNMICVRTSDKVFLYKINYKYNIECSLPIKNKEHISCTDKIEKDDNKREESIINIKKNDINKVDDQINNDKIEKRIYSYIDKMRLYHTIYNPIQKEVHEVCCFSGDIHQSYLLVISLKSGLYTLYIYNLKNMDFQNAVKVNISAYKGFKTIKWVKCYDMLVSLSNAGNNILVLKNKHLNNWSFFMSDFELIDSNIEVIEEDNEFDAIEIAEPKYANLEDNIWKYIIIYLNIFIKNKICIQNLVHPSCSFPTLYTGYYKNSPRYFFYESSYDFSKGNIICFNTDMFTGERDKKKEKQQKKNFEIKNNWEHFINAENEKIYSVKENTNDLTIVDNSSTVQLLAPSSMYYLYYKNIINFSI
ncbi:conserved Plasmodium protein, unknown function [Plasmodium berghei]|uniref:WD repeat-containing protein n=2 Tax=Plasmodium berghei TaxID=5821 RepID=A0A509AI65_PLABA|nr:conserved Plasmodium protein, unknown function [Plasmodium berghei ANKA]CXI28793.1 conserved Plasmodium protein, unknown function [Plasmodium berghei]SCM20619.1 conserved Plasmodium protein, unknown function [Plasmodium berghei]SCN24225.1 conserved Plasmodium protein, unknown function [Plasmodium berghei]SCO59440.1 conserved Plasmodium protein, unknown function [Plasmodium berghei]SCO60677.1 conserved Plasmodium protein, unknown function [Plasmodium berghei]|eukprot:XP_034420979.1 conserved Plasmodium protein, unknown function [Plasmodium berghei ANKA]